MHKIHTAIAFVFVALVTGCQSTFEEDDLPPAVSSNPAIKKLMSENDKRVLAHREKTAKLVADRQAKKAAVRAKEEACRAERLAKVARRQERKESEKQTAVAREQGATNVGIWVTKDGLPASESLKSLGDFVRYTVDKDTDAMGRMIESGAVITLKEGIRVRAMEHSDVAASCVRVRPVGDTVQFWTLREALKQGW